MSDNTHKFHGNSLIMLSLFNVHSLLMGEFTASSLWTKIKIFKNDILYSKDCITLSRITHIYRSFMVQWITSAPQSEVLMFQRNLLPLSSRTSKTLAPVYMTLHPQDSILTAVTASTSRIIQCCSFYERTPRERISVYWMGNRKNTVMPYLRKGKEM